MGINADKPAVIIVGVPAGDTSLFKKIFDDEYNAAEAETGAQALDMMNAIPEVAAVLIDISLPPPGVFGILRDMQADRRLRDIPAIVVTERDDEKSQTAVLDRGASDILFRPLNAELVRHRVHNVTNRREAACQFERNKTLEELLRQSEIDEKTGIYNKNAFFRKTSEMLRENPHIRYVLLRWDIDSFKIFNETYGVAAGDEFLAKVGEACRNNYDGETTIGRLEADHFALCMPIERFDESTVKKDICGLIPKIWNEFEFIVRIGVYMIDNPALDVALMCDRALIALRSAKNNYYERVSFYNDSMRESMMEEKEILGEMKRALEQKQFEVYFQPQYNYSTGALYGAEALVRWNHPAKGLISPGKFIPIFERNGFIGNVDEYVWETVCRLLRKWIDEGKNVVPVSVNISRRDIYRPHLCEFITGLVEKYGLDTSALRLEITESAYMEDAEQLIKMVEELRSAGFSVEMDDFGSGYSSLNTLKNVPVDTLKLDMKFLDTNPDDSKGGSILASVIRMAHWIRIPVIAEGVETKLQADYLKSVGCLYMQGYYFARPMPACEFEKMLDCNITNKRCEKRFAGDNANAENFLSVSTQSALIFNSFVGGAAIIEYDGSNVEALRLNDKYFEVMGTTREEYTGKRFHLQECFDHKNRGIFLAAIKGALESGCETGCEVETLPPKDGAEPVWLRIQLRFLAQNGVQNLLFMSVENITDMINLRKRNNFLSERLAAMMGDARGGDEEEFPLA